MDNRLRRETRLDTADELHAYIHEQLDYYIPRKAVCPGHSAPFDFVADAYFEREDSLLALGPRSGGKTVNIAILNVLDSAHKGASIVHVAGSLSQAKRCYKYSKGLWHKDQSLEARLEVPPLMTETRLKGGAVYEVLPASERSVRAPHAAKLRMDEIEEMADEVFDAALSIPISQDGIESQIVKTSTRHKAHGRMQKELDGAEESGARVYAWCIFETMQPCEEDCSSCLLEPDCQGRARNADGYLSYKDAVKAFRSLDRRVWSAERLCKDPSTEHLVYADFNRGVHNVKRDDLPGDLTITGAIDWGYDNPFVFLAIGESVDDRTFVTGETYERHRTDADMAKMCRADYPDVVDVYADPSNPDGIEEFKREGFRVHAKGSKVSDGLGLVRKALKPPEGPPRLHVVTADCPNFCAEMESYEMDKGKDKPKKKDDHGPDAIRYWHIWNRPRVNVLAPPGGKSKVSKYRSL